MPNKWIIQSNKNKQARAIHNNGDEINPYNVKWKKRLSKSELCGGETSRMLLWFISKLGWSFCECSLNNYSLCCTF